MAYRLSGDKLSIQPMMTYCQLYTKEETSAKLKSKHNNLIWWKRVLKLCLHDVGHFASVSML